jgi:uncharacterized protein (TIGR00730 family)
VINYGLPSQSAKSKLESVLAKISPRPKVVLAGVVQSRAALIAMHLRLGVLPRLWRFSAKLTPQPVNASLRGQLSFSVISGGGPGIMEAANKGAYEGSSPSIGLNIELPHEQTSNTWQNISLSFRHFFARKVAFVKYADAYIVLPGGFGTIDELSEVLVLIQTGKTQRIPVVLVGTKFWEGLLKWFKDTLLANGMVESQDLELVQVIDDPKEIVEAIYHFYESRDIVLSETEHPHQSFL